MSNRTHYLLLKTPRFLLWIVDSVARKKSTAESGKPDLDFEMNWELENKLEKEIDAEGIDYTLEELPAVMTCAGQHKHALVYE